MTNIQLEDVLKVVTTVTENNINVARNQEDLYNIIKEQLIVLKEATKERVDLKELICKTLGLVKSIKEEATIHNNKVEIMSKILNDLVDQTTNFSQTDKFSFDKVVKDIEKFTALSGYIPNVLSMIKDIEEAQLIKRAKFLVNGLVFIFSMMTVMGVSYGVYQLFSFMRGLK